MIANLEIILRKSCQNALKVGGVMHCKLAGIKNKYPTVIGAHHGMGLVAGLHMVKPGGKEPNGELAKAIVRRAVEKGLLMFAPVGFGGATVKICPPLCINEEASAEALHVLEDCIEESV
jgi:4-aminobutyrate aminotransferase-like enzyme